MRIVFVHNYYQQPGGEDIVFAAEKALLRERGHTVDEYTDHNQRIDVISPLTLAAQTIWSLPSKAALHQMLDQVQPDVVHFHNTFPLISPSAYDACREAGVPVVQTLHNYRLLCPAATLYRNGRVCEDCLHRNLPWPSLVFRCYHDSLLQTAVVVGMLAANRWRRIWLNRVRTYIALSEFASRKFAQGGLPAERIAVKPNFVHPDPGVRTESGSYALFIGRLSAEKGVRTLLQAWQSLPRIPLRIVGDGPLLGEALASIKRHDLDSVELQGRLALGDVLIQLKGARYLVFPSEWFETFGRVVAEAYACGVPVIASRLGTMTETVQPGLTGLHFEAGNPEDLAAKAEWAWTHPEAMEEMGRRARKLYESKYTAEMNYQMLLDNYSAARAARASDGRV